MRAELLAGMTAALDETFEAGPVIDGEATAGGSSASLVTCPHDRRERIGTVRATTPAQADAAIESATKAQQDWNARGGPARAEILEAAGGAIVVPPEDSAAIAQALAWLKANPDQAAAMARRGHVFAVEQYSRKALAHRYLDILQTAREARR